MKNDVNVFVSMCEIMILEDLEEGENFLLEFYYSYGNSLYLSLYFEV